MFGMGPTNANHYWYDKLTIPLTYVHSQQSTYKIGGEYRLESGPIEYSRRKRRALISARPRQDCLPRKARISAAATWVSLCEFPAWPVEQRDRERAAGSTVAQLALGTVHPGHLEDQPKAHARLRTPLGPAGSGPRDLGPQQHVRPEQFRTLRQAGGRAAWFTRVIGSGRCNCTFIGRYPYAIGPRLGVSVSTRIGRRACAAVGALCTANTRDIPILHQLRDFGRRLRAALVYRARHSASRRSILRNGHAFTIRRPVPGLSRSRAFVRVRARSIRRTITSIRMAAGRAESTSGTSACSAS